MLGGRILVLTYLPEPLLHCSPVLTLDTTTWTSCCSLNKPSFLCPLCFLFLECFPHSICLLLFPSKAQIACTSLTGEVLNSSSAPKGEAPPTPTTCCTSLKALLLICPCIVHIFAVVSSPN